MEPSYLDPIRLSYDAVAADYARTVKDPDALDPLSRAMLSAFAELVRAGGRGPVADVGCGPGKVTAHLAGLGVSAFGVDLSPGGHLLLVTRVGEEGHQRRTYGYGGDPAPFDSYRLPAERIAGLLEGAGFAVTGRLVQAPEEGAKRPVASFLARKPEAG
ncbi:SAM-dependent methyltransferase [Streptomyces sp. NPDC059258]|uniref:SAM-dependent methyltransferase n=1 Tax=unclassified Streptomyces TaxID=2593676 RepID=UPI0036AFB371